MRTLTLKLTAAITGRRVKPPIPDEELAAIKERARQLLEQATATTTAPDPKDLAPVPAPPPIRPFNLGPTPPPAYDPGRSNVQAMSRIEPFGSEVTCEPRPEKLAPARGVSWWDMAWARLTPSERAWSSQP